MSSPSCESNTSTLQKLHSKKWIPTLSNTTTRIWVTTYMNGTESGYCCGDGSELGENSVTWTAVTDHIRNSLCLRMREQVGREDLSRSKFRNPSHTVLLQHSYLNIREEATFVHASYLLPKFPVPQGIARTLPNRPTTQNHAGLLCNYFFDCPSAL